MQYASMESYIRHFSVAPYITICPSTETYFGLYLKGTYQSFSFFIANSFYMSDFMYLLRTQIISYNVQ